MPGVDAAARWWFLADLRLSSTAFALVAPANLYVAVSFLSLGDASCLDGTWRGSSDAKGKSWAAVAVTSLVFLIVLYYLRYTFGYSAVTTEVMLAYKKASPGCCALSPMQVASSWLLYSVLFTTATEDLEGADDCPRRLQDAVTISESNVAYWVSVVVALLSCVTAVMFVHRMFGINAPHDAVGMEVVLQAARDPESHAARVDAATPDDSQAPGSDSVSVVVEISEPPRIAWGDVRIQPASTVTVL